MMEHFRNDGTIFGMMTLFWPLPLALFSHSFHTWEGQPPKGEKSRKQSQWQWPKKPHRP